jgi:hypothetical protein
MNVPEYLELLGITADEFIGMLWKRVDGKPNAAVFARDAVEVIVEYQIPLDNEAYLAPNPTAGPTRPYDRGTEEQVTRVAALYADLDVKPGACNDIDAAHVIIDDIAAVLSERPAGIIFSGGGLQPIWTLDNCSPTVGIPLLKRFGRLVKLIGATRNAKLDSVFNADRVLRIPGTRNHKYGVPIEVLMIPDNGAPMDAATVSERLDEAGIFEESDDAQVGKPDVVVAEDIWAWARDTCGYAAETIRAWAKETPIARHPWYLSTSVRLECMRRNGCVTKVDYVKAKEVLVARFVYLLSQGDPRKPARMEIPDILSEAVDRASRKSASQLDTELGDVSGAGHVHLLSGPLPPTPNDVDPSGGNSGPGIPLVDDLEQGFWNSRESLSLIYMAALTRMCSPWAVLACCVARALALVPPNVTLPSLIGGGGGSLNWFGAVASLSGGGKGSSLSVARDLVGEYVYQRNLGSGEGMVTAYRTKETDDTPTGLRSSVMFTADEVDNVTALGSRSGSTLLPTLRSAFSGETLGFSSAGRGKDIHLDAHTYRLTLVCAIQPGRAAAILNDDAGGTPQRFMWFPAVDQRITKARAQEYNWQKFSLTLPPSKEWRYPREVILPPGAEDYILDCRVDSAQPGTTESMDSHAVFAREKFAYGLAVLDGRVQMSLQDWELSGIAAEVSAATRDWVASQMEQSTRTDAERRGEVRGYEAGAADESKAARTQARSDRIARWILERLRDVNGQGVSTRELSQAIGGRDRAFLHETLSLLANDEQIVGKPSPSGRGMIWGRP